MASRRLSSDAGSEAGSSTTAASPQAKSAVTRLLPYAFLCTIGPSVTAATSLYVVRYLMCIYDTSRHAEHQPSPGDGRCDSHNVGALTASVMAGLATLDGVFSFLTTSYVQRWADSSGRRPLMIILPLLAMVASGSMVIAYMIRNPTLSWFLLALNGIFVSASTKSVFVPSLSIADVSSESGMTKAYSLLEAVTLLGPGSAYILSALSSRYIPIVLFPYYIALGSQFLATLYALIAVPETLPADTRAEVDSIHSQEGIIEAIVLPVIKPIKPLRLLLPRKEADGWHWRLSILTVSLLFTTSGTVFIVTASLLFLSDKFAFNPESNAWVLAYLAFAKGGYLTLVFPSIQRWGRRVFHKYGQGKGKVSGGEGERQPLLENNGGESKEAKQEEANQFDVILLFLSVCIDAVSLVGVSLAQDYKHALVAFGIFALGGGDNPTYKSVFVASVPEEHASQSLAALDMVFNAARLLSPILLGSVYAVFAEMGRPEMLFLVAGGLCAVGATLLTPLIFTRIGNK